MISESTIVIWDFHDRPILRTIIFLSLPIQAIRLLSSFKGNRNAIIIKGVLFIIEILENAPRQMKFPFQPAQTASNFKKTTYILPLAFHKNTETCCLFKDTFLIVIYRSKLHFKTPLGIKFLSENLLILITTEAVQ